MSDSTIGPTGAVPRAADAAARAAKARRAAWLLAGLAVFVYVGYIAWMALRANAG